MLKTKVNNILFDDVWKKYAEGNVSKWEMDSVSFYSHKHELDGVDFLKKKLLILRNFQKIQ